MAETSIPRKPALATAFDYQQLRAEGMQHIRQLSGQVWTDHNLHDPGITSLEVLCYALTDLAYRTGFDTVDLMTGPDGRMDPASLSGLAPAHEVLPTAPRTLFDYRRLLLRIEGVRNAWLDPMQDPADEGNYRLSEVPLYADCLADGLSYSPLNAAGKANHPVRLSGLYRVLVELEVDELLGSMNESALTWQVRRGDFKGLVLAFDCPRLQNIDFSTDFLGLAPGVLTPAAIPSGYQISLTLTDGQQLQDCIIRVINDRPRPDHPPLNVDAGAIASILAGDELLAQFWRKQQRRAATLARVRCVLHAHRGLCEDFLSIASVIPYRIGVCADVEVSADADLELVQARVYHEIEKYLSPPVRFHSLQQMLEAGHQPDAIFNGPFIDFAMQCDGQPVFTRPGFITDQDLAATELRRQVNASDIINLVVDIKGVEAIRDLQLRVYGSDGLPLADAVRWTLPVPAGHQPVFFMQRSKLLFHKAGIPYRAQLTEFQRTLDYLRALDRRELYVAPEQILPVPLGEWRQLDTFYSVQDDFPATYRIGQAGISPTESAQRIAQARQLKGYLMFFDQLLADYLGQLAGLRRLYSLDATLDRSWFSLPLSGIAGSLQDFDSEFWVDGGPDDLARVRLNETEEAFQERRNRVLDHLLARFAERFADYALLSFRLSGDRLQTGAQLISDKIDFLAEYPRLSRERGQAGNLEPEDPAQLWDSGNIAGLQRRVGRLLGIDDLSLRDLHCASHFTDLIQLEEAAGQFHLVIRDGDGELLFRSKSSKADQAAMQLLAEQAWAGLREETTWQVAASGGTTTFRLSILGADEVLEHDELFDSEADAFDRARAIVARYDELLAGAACNSEGMHLIEHILLRPLSTADRLLSVCLPEGCEFCGEDDPYSFQVSVVLPCWPERFANLHFRALLERSMREEAPAHVQLKICWIGQQQMRELDAAWQAWLQARAARPLDSLLLRQCAASLIAVLESLTTVYPAASLHDCDVGEDQTIVRLGSTALGIF